MRRTLGHKSVVAAIAALALLAPAYPVHAADEPGNGDNTAASGSDVTNEGTVTGGDISSPEPEFANNPDSIAKVELTTLWQQMLEGKISVGEYQRAARAHQKARGLTAPPGSIEAQPIQRSGMKSRVLARAATSRTLPLTHMPQANGYFCGPATGRMLVKITNGSITSQYNGASFTQGSFGGPAHMETSTYGKTSWQSGLFTRGVNRWRGQAWYAQVDRPSASLVTAALSQSIGNNGMPVAADTVELAGGAHYNGHPVNQDIGHWILAYGYSNSGSNVQFADPSTSVWGGVSATFSASTSTFINNYLGYNGTAY